MLNLVKSTHGRSVFLGCVIIYLAILATWPKLGRLAGKSCRVLSDEEERWKGGLQAWVGKRTLTWLEKTSVERKPWWFGSALWLKLVTVTGVPAVRDPLCQVGRLWEQAWEPKVKDRLCRDVSTPTLEKLPDTIFWRGSWDHVQLRGQNALMDWWSHSVAPPIPKLRFSDALFQTIRKKPQE